MKQGAGILRLFASLLGSQELPARSQPAMDVMAKMLFRRNENGGRMAFNSDFRKVHLWKRKRG